MMSGHKKELGLAKAACDLTNSMFDKPAKATEFVERT